MIKPLIVGIGGTLRPGSSSEQALAAVLAAAEVRGAVTLQFAGPDISLPPYDPQNLERTPSGKAPIEALRRADGVVLSSPCYHGGISGLVKNAIDYTEDMRGDALPYLDGRAVGLIACGYGYQGLGIVLGQLRSITHALRGWPVPIGVGINSQVVKFDAGQCSDAGIASQLDIMAAQIVEFAEMKMAAKQMRSAS